MANLADFQEDDGFCFHEKGNSICRFQIPL